MSSPFSPMPTITTSTMESRLTPMTLICLVSGLAQTKNSASAWPPSVLFLAFSTLPILSMPIARKVSISSLYS